MTDESSSSSSSGRTTINNYLHVAGGDDWKLLTALPTERVSFTSVKLGRDQIAVVGGQYKHGVPTTSSSRLTELLMYLWNRQRRSNNNNNMMMMIDFVDYTDQVSVWNLRRNRWSTWTMSMPRRRPSVVAWDDDTLVICGGYAHGRSLDSCEVVHTTRTTTPQREQQQLLPPMHWPRDCGRAVLYRDRYLIVLGGDMMATVEMLDLSVVFDPDENQNDSAAWTALPSMNYPREYFSAVIVNDWLVVAGGDDDNRIMEVLDLQDLLHAMTTGQELPIWKVSQQPLPVHMASMGTVAIAAPPAVGEENNQLNDNVNNRNHGMTLILANGMKENSVHALTVAPSPNHDPQVTTVWPDATWSQLPKTKVPCWERDLILVGDTLVAIGDTWIEGLQLTGSSNHEQVLQAEDFSIPYKRVATWVYNNFDMTKLDRPVHAVEPRNNNNSWQGILFDPRLRNAAISIAIIWFLFFRNQPSQQLGRDQGRRLGRQ